MITMKQCPTCNGTFSDDRTRCPYDGAELKTNSSEKAGDSPVSPIQENPPLGIFPASTGGSSQAASSAQHRPLTRRTLLGYRFEGAVEVVNSRQYYPTALSKVLRSLFSGEPYQFGHTSFENVIRIAELREYGMPEEQQDVILYGNLQTNLSAGDVVLVEAKRKHGTFVAKRIYNQTTNSRVRLQQMIPALAVRLLAIALLWLCSMILLWLFSIDYFALIQNMIVLILRIVSPFISYILMGIIMYVLIRYIIKGRRG